MTSVRLKGTLTNGTANDRRDRVPLHAPTEQLCRWHAVTTTKLNHHHRTEYRKQTKCHLYIFANSSYKTKHCTSCVLFAVIANVTSFPKQNPAQSYTVTYRN